MSIELTVMSLDFDSDEPPLKQIFHKDEVNFGRSDDNDIVLPGEEVSNLHAKLIFVQENGSAPRLFITDMGSVNGTLVDNIPLEPYKSTELGVNQRILISGYLIKPKAIEKPHVETVKQETFTKPQIKEDASSESVWSVEDDVLISPVEINAESAQEETFKNNQSPVNDFNYAPPSATKEVETSAIILNSEVKSSHFSSDGINIQDDEVLVFNFEAKKLCQLHIELKRKGAGLAGVQLVANGNVIAQTDSNGVAFIKNIEEGSKISLTAVKDGFVFEPSQISLAVEHDHKISVSARKLVSVKGKIQHRGQALAGVKVNAGSLGQTTTDASGVYEFKNVIEGTPVSVSVEKDGFVFNLI